jgi:hypothetical protein
MLHTFSPWRGIGLEMTHSSHAEMDDFDHDIFQTC